LRRPGAEFQETFNLMDDEDLEIVFLFFSNGGGKNAVLNSHAISEWFSAFHFFFKPAGTILLLCF